MQPHNDPVILREKDLMERYGIYPSSRRRIPDFPGHIKLGSRSIGWIREEVDAWVRIQASRRDQEAAAQPAPRRRIIK